MIKTTSAVRRIMFYLQASFSKDQLKDLRKFLDDKGFMLTSKQPGGPQFYRHKTNRQTEVNINCQQGKSGAVLIQSLKCKTPFNSMNWPIWDMENTIDGNARVSDENFPTYEKKVNDAVVPLKQMIEDAIAKI